MSLLDDFDPANYLGLNPEVKITGVGLKNQ